MGSKGWILLVGILLAILHQDFWLWDDGSVLFGFLPIGLGYHAAYSIVVALYWWWVVRAVWPADSETSDDEAAP
ncbi:MAG: hypothetical protein CMH54_14370 [Myxococcales bacterium]|nr:hypothetical protein [Myxococcales bacterium]